MIKIIFFNLKSNIGIGGICIIMQYSSFLDSITENDLPFFINY